MAAAWREAPRVLYEIGLGGMLAVLAGISLLVLIPVLAIGLIVRLAADRRPEDRLRKRLFRGEISQAEFDAAMLTLGR
jgi:hypothetical protein